MHGTTQEYPGRPLYICVDEMPDLNWSDIYPVDMVVPKPSVPIRVVRYKRAAVSSADPDHWRYDFVGTGF